MPYSPPCPAFTAGPSRRACRSCAAAGPRLPAPGPHLAPHRTRPPFDPAGRVGVQPAAELRHVQRHGHERHVPGALRACPSPPSLHSRALSPCMPLVRCRRPTPSRPRPTPRSASYALLPTRQSASAFNQPLSFDTSSVTTRPASQPFSDYMFWVRFAHALAHPQPSQPGPLPVHAARDALLPAHNSLPHPGPHLAPHRTPLPPTRQGANALSDANKLLIRCAWAGTLAFASAGYGASWGPGSCT